MSVLRLCSVFASPSPALAGRGRAFDPVGGLQTHAAELTRTLDRRGVTQTVVTATRPGAPPFERLGESSCLVRVGVPIRRLRQLYSVPAFFLAQAFAARADLVHVHLGEDLAVLPIGLAAARLHRLPLVLTVHSSFRHTLPALNARTALLKAVGGAVERFGERRADAVIVLTARLARLLAEEGVDERSIFVVPSGVNGALFIACGDDLFPELGRPRVLFVGRLVPQKDAERLLVATRLLANESARVLLVGRPPRSPARPARSRVGDRPRSLGSGARGATLGRSARTSEAVRLGVSR